MILLSPMVNRHEKENKSTAGKLADFIRTHHQIMIIGIGNRNRSDDGAGIATAMKLKRIISNKNVCVIVAEKGLLQVLPTIERKKPDGLIIIDAAELGAKAGYFTTLGPDSIEEKGLSTHENNIIPALTYFSASEFWCDIVFICIQYGDTAHSKRLYLSADVKKAVEELVSIISRLLSS